MNTSFVPFSKKLEEENKEVTKKDILDAGMKTASNFLETENFDEMCQFFEVNYGVDTVREISENLKDVKTETSYNIVERKLGKYLMQITVDVIQFSSNDKSAIIRYTLELSDKEKEGQ